MTLTPESSTLDSHDALFCLHCTNSCASSHQVVKLLESAGTAALISDGRGPTHRWQINIWRPMELFLNFRRPRQPERLLLGIMAYYTKDTNGLQRIGEEDWQAAWIPHPLSSGGTAVHQVQSSKSENSFFLTAAGLFNKNKAQVPPCETAFHPHSIISLLH